MTPVVEIVVLVYMYLKAKEMRQHTSIGITGEVASPLNIGATLVLARGDGKAADGADNTGVADGGLAGDDRVGDVVVEGRVLLLLDLNDGAVVEGPADNVSLLVGALDVVAALESRPELAEVLELDEVPDVGERGCYSNSISDMEGIGAFCSFRVIGWWYKLSNGIGGLEG